ncbi:hypothetical protein ACH5RR_037302 [Cinchona calisaya]|uniref:RNase H type-1 domain-containing protein n=1 Tax=Cinchona calisaya TaxID=153742 RepID=A0ABD2Y721_9GENT
MLSMISIGSQFLVKTDSRNVAVNVSVTVLQPKLSRPIAIAWQKPMQGMKMNVDGSLSGNPGPSGTGGIVRIPEDKYSFFFYKSLTESTNLEAESLALLHDLEPCLNHGHLDVKIEMDSKELYCMVTSKDRIAWKIDHVVR